MKKCFVVFILSNIIILSPGCPTAPSATDDPVKIDKNVMDAAQSVNKFAIDLYGKLKGQEGNLFLSPSSISTALAMTYAGARGETAAEMKKVLHFTLDDKDLHPAMGNLTKLLSQKHEGCSVSIANALWGQKGYCFLEEFLDLTQQNYGAGLQQVDFAGATEQARKTINTWVEENTNSKIKELLKKKHMDNDIELILTNAIYFKGTWEYPFKKEDTRREKFDLSKEKSIQTELMYMRKPVLRYMEGKGFKALELPYAGQEVSMVIFLPYRVDGLPEFEKSLTKENVAKWLAEMQKTPLLAVAIPRFKMTCEFELEDSLMEMGMVSAFGESADFSGMSGGKGLYILDVILKAFVDVNEEGTEAAAATAVSVKNGYIFHADHPFLFLIRDNRTGAILFLGRLVDPKS